MAPDHLGTPASDIAPLLDIAQAGRHIASIAEYQAHRKIVQQLKPVVETVMGSSIQIYSAAQNDSSFQFHVQSTMPCPLCKGYHGTSLYNCDCVLSPCCAVKNQDSHCKQHIIGWERVEVFTDIMQNPAGDAPYAQLFNMHQASVGHAWKYDGSSFYMHDGVLWRILG